MPLTVEGSTLNPDVAEALPEPQILDITHFPQDGKLWCWAACVQMVLDYYHRTKPEKGVQDLTQCEIVQKMVGHSDNPCPDNRDMRLDSCDFDEMVNVWKNCKIEGAAMLPGPVKMDGIKHEIAKGRPIEVGIKWTKGGGHAVLIKGWAATNPETLVIDDPLRQSSLGKGLFPDSGAEFEPDGSGRATHQDLKSAFGNGQWSMTYGLLE
jgi:hypothetical protein